MKPYLFAVTAISFAITHSAIADVTLYGRANVSLQAIKDTTADGHFTAQDNVELISNRSRFGVKGEEQLNDNLKAMYQMEWEVAVDSGDTGSGNAIKQRSIFVGLGGNWGAVLVGLNDTPVKMLDKPIDLFADLKYGDIDSASVGTVRQKNSVMYRSPVMSGVNVDVMFAPGEDKGSDSLNNAIAANKRNGAADSISVAFAYQLEGFKIALGVDNKIDNKLTLGSIDGTNPNDIGSKAEYLAETNLIRVVASYDSSVLGVAGMMQHAKQSNGQADSLTLIYDLDLVGAAVIKPFGKTTDTESLDTIAVAAYYLLGDIKLKALMLNTDFDISNLNLQQIALGADYTLAKSAKVFAYVAQLKANDNSIEYATNHTLGVGIEYNF